MRIAGQAVFLTGDGHTIHAWVHGPSVGRVRGAVIVAPALAREEVVSHRGMRSGWALLATSPLPSESRVLWTPVSGAGAVLPAPPSADPEDGSTGPRSSNDVELSRTWHTRLGNGVRRRIPGPVWLARGRATCRTSARQTIDNAVGLAGDTLVDRHEDNTEEVATCAA